MTKLPEIISVVPTQTIITEEVKCLYCGSSNCGALYGDPICHELPIPEQKDMLGLE